MIDWSSLVSNFQKAHIGVAELANIASVTQQEIADLLHGRIPEPLFSSGIKLIDAHFDKFPDKHKALLEE